MQERFAEKRGCLNSRLTHTHWIGRVDFGLQEADDEWKEHFAEYGGPFFMFARCKFGGEESTL